MYIPEHFAEPRADELARIIHAHPLGMLVTHGTDGLDADHIPFAFDPAAGPYGTLNAHVARANPVWQRCAGAAVMVVFRGAEGYISPNWYPSKHESHRQVPTWNYRVVHVHGKLHIRDDERFVRGVVARLTKTHEAQTGAPRPWKMTDSAPEYIDQLLGMIVGIEVEVTRMVGKWKLSQNKEERDRRNAAKELGERGEREISAAMLATIPNKG